MKNEAVVQSHIVFLRNLENQIGQLAIALSNTSQGSLPSNTEDLRRERKENYKVINLRSEKDVHSPVCAPKRKIESNKGQEDTQVEEESQSSTFQNANQHNSTTAYAENNDPAMVERDADPIPTTLAHNMAKKKQLVQHIVAQQFRYPQLFPQDFGSKSKISSSAKSWEY